MSDYERLEADGEKPSKAADHRAVWDGLTPLLFAEPVVRERVETFARSKRISLEALIALGTRLKVDRHGGVELAWGYPHRNGNGETITAVKYRPLDPTKKRYAEPYSVFVTPLVLGRRDSLDWFLAEGETDAARLYELVGEVAAVLVLPAGALTFKPSWAALIPRGATVHLCHDADEAGDRGALKATKLLSGRTVRIRPPLGDWCDWAGSSSEFVELVRAARSDDERPFALPIGEFVALERSDVEALLSDDDGRPLIARNSLTMLGARGGQGKTTLFVELALHLAAGVDYLGFTIPHPASVLLIENEGPEQMFAEKLAAKLAGFPHEIKGRLDVCVFDWGGFTLADGRMLARLREEIATNGYDLVFGDPLDSLGIEGVGSPEDTRKFLELMKQTGLNRNVAWWLNTHPRKEETKEALDEIAGAWGGKPDTVLLLKMLDDDRSQLRFPKIRWAKRGRRPSVLLAFDAETETFTFLGEESEDERDYLAEIVELLAGGAWMTVGEIAAKKDAGGIGAGKEIVKKLLEGNPDRFSSRTGEAAKEIGRHPSSTVWKVERPPVPAVPPLEIAVSSGERWKLDSPYRNPAPPFQSSQGVDGLIDQPVQPFQPTSNDEQTLEQELADPAFLELETDGIGTLLPDGEERLPDDWVWGTA